MRIYTATLLVSLAIIAASRPSQAVVHGINPLRTQHYELPNDNRNGYRYNGPAHKYLPAATAPATEAVTTTGHWQPNPVQLLEQQLPYEHTFSSTPSPAYNGPYSMKYYQRDQHRLSGDYQQQQQSLDWRQQQLSADMRQQQQHTQAQYNNLNTFPYATNNKIAAAPGTSDQFGAAYGLSGATHNIGYMESGLRDNQLIGQALPERYQRQPFASQQQHSFEQLLGGSADFVQMQSHSYELPASYSMHREYPEQQQQYLQQQQQQQQQYEQQQQHQQQEQKHDDNNQLSALQFRPQQAYHQEDDSLQGIYRPPAQMHYSQPDYYHDSSSLAQPQSQSQSHSHTLSNSDSHLSFEQPSREFQAPYY